MPIPATGRPGIFPPSMNSTRVPTSRAKPISWVTTTMVMPSMVFQHFNLFPNMTIRKNITLAPVRTGLMKQEEADELAGSLLQRVDLTDKADAYPSQLSGCASRSSRRSTAPFA